jgi:hypothetical protein
MTKTRKGNVRFTFTRSDSKRIAASIDDLPSDAPVGECWFVTLAGLWFRHERDGWRSL